MDVVVALIVSGGRVLVERRDAADEHSPGVFRFPAGHVEPGEALEAALRREVQEELSRVVVSARKVRETPFTGADGIARRLHYFRVELDAAPGKAERLRWFGPADRDRMPFSVDRELIEELLG